MDYDEDGQGDAPIVEVVPECASMLVRGGRQCEPESELYAEPDRPSARQWLAARGGRE